MREDLINKYIPVFPWCSKMIFNQLFNFYFCFLQEPISQLEITFGGGNEPNIVSAHNFSLQKKTSSFMDSLCPVIPYIFLHVKSVSLLYLLRAPVILGVIGFGFTTAHSHSRLQNHGGSLIWIVNLGHNVHPVNFSNAANFFNFFLFF